MRALLLVGLLACTASDPAPTISHAPPRLLRAHAVVTAPMTAPADAARWHVQRLASAWGFDAAELVARGELAIGGATIVRLAQQLDGLPIEGGELRVLVKAGALVGASGVPVPRTIARDVPSFAGDEAGAIARATSGRAREARARRAWWRGDAELVAAWIVEAYLRDGRALRIAIAARDGRVLETHDLVDDAAFDYRVYAGSDLRPLDGPLADSTPHPTGLPDGSYPPFVGPSLVRVDGLDVHGDPWLPDGATETNGNHADAYVDIAEPDGFGDGDFRATTTAPGVFDHAYDTALDPLDTRTQQEAAITQLFYTANALHDFWYDAGFTEAAGNAQLSNYGRGGVEGDPLRLEAQDSALDGVRNNANMATPSDGMSPRMQMYLFRGIESRSLTVRPSGREPETASAAFGQREHDLQAEVALADPADACTAVAPLASKIALVQAAACAPELAVGNVQAAGAVGALVVHSQTGPPPGLADDPAIDTAAGIPVFSISQDEGTALVGELAAGAVTARMVRAFTPEPDSSLDALIVAHEYGHYLHRRLSVCNTKLCSALSEGWGDFVALLFASRDGDDLDGAYPVGAYATQTFSDDPAYFGVRRVPYSVDRAIDPLTFRHMADGEALPQTPMSPSRSPNSEVHNAGEVWATALWEAYVALQKAHPGEHAAMRARMASYVVAGLAMTPPDATPTEARDALVLAAAANDPADAETLLAAFASRGLGSCALSPVRTSGDNVGIVESAALAGAAAAGVATVDDALDSCDGDGLLDDGERGRLVAPITNFGHRVLENLSVSLVAADGSGLSVLGAPVAIARLAPGESIDVAFELALVAGRNPVSGRLALHVAAPGSCNELVTLDTAFRMNGDDVPASATLDKFDAPSIWTTRQAAIAPAWSQRRMLPGDGNYDGRWVGDDLATLSDSSLVSPPIDASPTEPLSIAFTHRFDFEYSDDIAWDGGVVEVSTDGGATWRDIAELGVEPGYTHVLTDVSGNPLSNRRAFARQNIAFPTFETVTLDLGTQLAGQRFQLRFRLGTDEATGGFGWEIDSVDMRGIVGTPFPSQKQDAALCEVGDDGGCCGSSRELPVGGLLLAWLVIRPRRAARCRAFRRSRELRRRRA